MSEEGELTSLKCVADKTFLTGSIRASLTMTAMSLPEYLRQSAKVQC